MRNLPLGENSLIMYSIQDVVLSPIAYYQSLSHRSRSILPQASAGLRIDVTGIKVVECLSLAL
jgi:hypothetical protein